MKSFISLLFLSAAFSFATFAAQDAKQRTAAPPRASKDRSKIDNTIYGSTSSTTIDAVSPTIKTK